MFIYTVCSPNTIIFCLFPGNTYYRIIIIRRMTEIIFYIRFVVSKFTSPNQSIGFSAIYYCLVLRITENIFYPIQIHSVVNIGYFCFVNKKRIYSHSSRHIIPISHYIFLRSTHGKCTALHKYQTGSSFNGFWFSHIKIAVGFIVIV